MQDIFVCVISHFVLLLHALHLLYFDLLCYNGIPVASQSCSYFLFYLNSFAILNSFFWFRKFRLSRALLQAFDLLRRVRLLFNTRSSAIAEGPRVT